MSEVKLIEIEASKEIAEGDVRKAVIGYDFGADVNEAIAKFGAEVVHSNFIRAAKITAQAAMRRMLESNKNQEEISTAMAGWKPGVSLERTYDPLGALTNKMKDMTEEEIAEVFERLKAAAGRS